MAGVARLLARIRRNQRGASLVEFALVAPVMCGFILGFLEFAHWAYVRATVAGAIEEVARTAGVGGAAVDPRAAEIEFENTVKVVAADATFNWVKQSYYQFSGVGKPEKLTDDKDKDGAYDTGDCWEDLNPNGTYDTSPGRLVAGCAGERAISISTGSTAASAPHKAAA